MRSRDERPSTSKRQNLMRLLLTVWFLSRAVSEVLSSSSSSTPPTDWAASNRARRPPPPPPPPRHFPQQTSGRNDDDEDVPDFVPEGAEAEQVQWGSADLPRRQERQRPNDRFSSRGRPAALASGAINSSNRNSYNFNQQPPIHYNFPAAASSSSEAAIRQETMDPQQQPYHLSSSSAGRRRLPATASARSDPVTRHWSSRTLHLPSRATAALWGVATGAFGGHALMLPQGTIRGLSTVLAIAFVVLTFVRNNVFADLIRCLVVATFRAVQRFRRIRRRYPTHVAACLGMGTRRPFPTPAQEEEEDFPKLYSTLAASVVGSLVVGTLPLLPTWLGALLGLAAGGYLTTRPTARGDLARTVGARVVALLRESAAINRELRVLPACGAVAEVVWDRLLFLDRQHRIRDKVTGAVGWMYQQAMSAATSSTGSNNDVNDRPGDNQSEDDQRRQRTRRPTTADRREDEYNRTDRQRRQRRPTTTVREENRRPMNHRGREDENWKAASGDRREDEYIADPQARRQRRPTNAVREDNRMPIKDAPEDEYYTTDDLQRRRRQGRQQPDRPAKRGWFGSRRKDDNDDDGVVDDVQQDTDDSFRERGDSNTERQPAVWTERDRDDETFYSGAREEDDDSFL